MDLREAPRHAFHRHPWEIARFRFFRRVLRDAHLDARPMHILDVGSGDAWLAGEMVSSLDEGSVCTCWDPGYVGASLPLAFHDPRLTAVTERPKRHFDLILLLDVLEHVPEDGRFLEDLISCCAKPGTHLLFSVPAWPGLTCSHDQALLHHRRYHPKAALALLEAAQLRVLASGGAFHALLLPRAARVLKERLLGPRVPSGAESLQWRGGDTLAKLVETALAADGALSRYLAAHRRELPGLSWWALCQK